jgi:hypothetical protein
MNLFRIAKKFCNVDVVFSLSLTVCSTGKAMGQREKWGQGGGAGGLGGNWAFDSQHGTGVEGSL